MAALVATIYARRRLLGTGLILASHTPPRRPERAPDDDQHPEASISLINSVEMTCQAIF
jgi:hypothetical protein